MSWVPRSLFGRNLLLIVVLIASAQVGGAVLMRELVLRPRLEQIGDGLARNVAALRAGRLTLPAERRGAFVDEFNRRGLAGPPAAPEPGLARSGLTPLERRFVRTIAGRFASEDAGGVWRRETGGNLSIRLTVEGAPYWVVLPGGLPARELTGTWIAASLAGASLALMGAFAIQRRLNRPLAQVVNAAGELARGAVPSPLPEDGPLETATLARSFNQLVASLARADRERALMLAGVSHDLRTPLAKLRFGVEILADRSEPELTASMNRSIAEMDLIVGQFLDFARGDDAEAMVEGDLDAIVKLVVRDCADHGQPVEIALGAPPRVRLREQALKRCLKNLVENAFRYGGAPVGIRTGADGGAVWVEVTDRGDGIAAGDVEAMKQPFRRAQAPRSGAPGAGLGLAIVERLVRTQRGRFELLLNTPRGLRARITLAGRAFGPHGEA